MKYTLLNGWENIHFICNHRHKEPQAMQILQSAKAVFYACPKYFPDNREADEPSCVNAIFLNDAEKAVSAIHDRLGRAAQNDEEVNLKNYRFTIDNVDYKVTRDDNGDMDVEVLNRKVVHE